MNYAVKYHRLPILILLGLFACLIAPSTQSSVTTAGVVGGSPMRLRLKVQSNTIKSGEGTKIFVEFLDRDYKQVPNDGTRVIEFGLGSSRFRQSGSGEISPQSVTVKPGVWSAETTFASRQAGKVLITARAEGLEPAQTLLVVTPPGSSFLSRLFETVAYAEGTEGFEITPFSDEATANGNEQVTCLVSFTKRPPGNMVIKISVEPPAAILYNGKVSILAHIPLNGDDLVSPEFGIRSRKKGKVNIKASVLPEGPNDNASVNFIAPHPSRIIFGDDLRDISSTQSTVPLLIELADDGGSPVEPVGEELINFKAANGEGFVKFDPPSVSLSTNRRSAQTMLQLTGLPLGNELKLLAVAQGQSSLTTGQKSIIIRSPIEKVMITGPKEVTRGKTGVEYTVRLIDKEGKHVVADWDRRINLSATDGLLTPAEMTIRKGEDGARVRYTSPSSIGTVKLTADSGGLPPGYMEILVVVAPIWLVSAALFGGLVGGIVRQIHKDYKLTRIMPKWNGECWELGLVGRITSSVVSGLFLYWTIKFGLGQMIGSPALPASLDLGARTVAFFFGGIGGFAGTVVFDRLVSWCLPAPQKKVQAPVADTGHPNPTQA